MTNLDREAAVARATVRIPTASGDDVEAWLYLPEGNGPHPAVVMAHGIGAIKAGGLGPFAERFCREGFAAVAFDYRQWGGSGGQPREEMSFPRQLEDYRTVIGWTAAHARSLLSFSWRRPVRRAAAISCPILFTVAEHDTMAPTSPAIRAAETAPHGELHRSRGGHYDVYQGGQSFDDVLQVEVEFLHQHAKTEQ
jgi:fermentation-respiration switch protein FrsA (DUF1100 family)